MGTKPMTREEAARILDPETNLEALRAYARNCEARQAAIVEACRMGARALRGAPSDEPLTPEHLRERVGQWVWVEVNYDHDGELFQCDGWALVPTPAFVAYLDQTIPIDFYGKKFLAYDYPPARKED